MIFRALPLLILILLAGCNRPAIAPGHAFSIRLGSKTAESEMVAMDMPSTGQKIYVASEDIVSSEDVVEIEIFTDQTSGDPLISIAVDRPAGARLEAATTRNAGKLCVFLVNGKVVVALPIEQPFGARFILEGDFNESEVDDGVSLLTGYW